MILSSKLLALPILQANKFNARMSEKLCEEINDKFAAAGLEIAFPQRDVHLDMGQPLRIQWDQVPPLNPGESGPAAT